MDQEQIREHYERPGNAGTAYLQRRFSTPGGDRVSGLELTPFKQWVDLGADRQLLDVASGTGRILGVLPRNSLHRATALDTSPAMLAHLRQSYPEAQAVSADIFTFDSTRKFDVITALRFFDHFSLSDQEKLLARLVSLLAAGGSIVISFLVRPSLESASNRLLRVGQMNYFNRRAQYHEVFRRCGLKSHRSFTCFVLPRGTYYRLPKALVPPAITLEKVLSRALPWFCSYMACELRKP